jgi:hypothetical protein
MLRLNGWNPRGERLVSDAPMGHWDDRESVKVTARKAAQLICDLSYPVERPKP